MEHSTFGSISFPQYGQITTFASIGLTSATLFPSHQILKPTLPAQPRFCHAQPDQRLADFAALDGGSVGDAVSVPVGALEGAFQIAAVKQGSQQQLCIVHVHDDDVIGVLSNVTELQFQASHAPQDHDKVSVGMTEGKDGIYIAEHIFREYATVGSQFAKNLVTYAIDRYPIVREDMMGFATEATSTFGPPARALARFTRSTA